MQQRLVWPRRGANKNVDNLLMAAPAKVTQNTTESTAATTQVTTQTQNSMDTDTKIITRIKMVEREAMMMNMTI